MSFFVTCLRWLLDPALGDHLPFAVCLLAVTFTAWMTSLGPSLLTLVLGTLSADYFFAPPRYTLAIELATPPSLVGLMLYLIVGSATIAAFEASRRARSRAELRRRELEITLASIGDGVITTDGRGSVTGLNPVAAGLTGWTPGEAPGRSLEEVFRIIDDETRAIVSNPIARVLAEGIVLGLANHTVLVAKDGTERPIDDSAAPIRDEEGNILGVVLIFRDVTERRRAERESSQLAAIVTSSDDAIIGENLDGTITSWNRGAEKLYGYGAAEVIGKSISIVVPPEQRDDLTRMLDRIRRGEQISHYETVRVRKGGERVPVSIAMSPVLDSSGSVVGAAAIARDITERKRTEEHLGFLAQATAHFGASLDFDTTMKNIVKLAVPALADWAVVDLATPESDQPYRRLAVIHVDPAKTELAMELRRRYPPDPEKDRVFHAIRTGQSVLVNEVSEQMLRDVARNDEHFAILNELGLVSFMIVPLRYRDRPIGAVTFVSSDSRRRFSESDLALAEEFARRASTAFENSRLYMEAQQANQAKDNFLATLSHELRTPMTSILGWSRMLAEGDLDSDTYKQAIDSIQRGAALQAELIDDVLDMSRIVAGKMRLDVRMCDLAEITESALTTVEPAASAKRITITVRKSGSSLVTGDPKRLQQVMWNLLTNAIKFTPKEGIVNVSLDQRDSMAEVTVSDTGQGFTPEFGAHLFEPFRQAESPITRTQGGLGLGLSIVRYLVEQHGGTVSAESAGVGKGATFRVRIPLRLLKFDDSLEDEGPTRLAADGRVPCSQNQLGNLRILFVDDQEDARKLFSKILERCGASVAVAQSVDEAIEQFDRQRFDLVVTDIAIPGKDGFELIAFLNEQGNRSDFRIIALTAFGGALDREKVLAAGCEAYLKKPVEPEELILTIERVTKRESIGADPP